jgi:hypothetical protein
MTTPADGCELRQGERRASDVPPRGSIVSDRAQEGRPPKTASDSSTSCLAPTTSPLSLRGCRSDFGLENVRRF